MAKSIFSGKEYAEWPLGCSGVMLVVFGAVALATLIPPRNTDTAIEVGACAAVAGGLFFWRAWKIARSRRWLTAVDDGFILTDYRGKYFISDDDVTDVTLSERTVPFQSGLVTHRAFRVTFRVGDRTESFEGEQYVDAGKADTLGVELGRALETLVARTREAIEQGGSLEGDGWVINRDALTIGTGTEARRIPLADIAAVEWVDNGVAVWARGSVEPELKAAGTRRGAMLLFRVWEFLRDARRTDARRTPSVPGSTTGIAAHELAPVGRVPGPSDNDQGSDELGRLIFSRQTGTSAQALRSARWAAVIGGVLGTIWTIAGFLPGNEHPRASQAQVLGPLVLVTTVGGYFALRARRGGFFRCHENGVVDVTRMGTYRLLFRDVGSFTYEGTRVLVNGAYAKTQVKLVFGPWESGCASISYEGEFQYDDQEIGRLRDHVSRMIAGYMAGRLRAGETVEWTPQFAFTPGGLAVRRGGQRKDGEWGDSQIVSYARVGGHELKEGVLHLRFEGDFGRPVTEKVSEMNFFPGYYLLMLLTGPDNVPTEVVPAT